MELFKVANGYIIAEFEIHGYRIPEKVQLTLLLPKDNVRRVEPNFDWSVFNIFFPLIAISKELNNMNDKQSKPMFPH